MSEKTLVTGQSEIAQKIVQALGLKDFCIESLELTINTHEAIKAKAIIYPTKEQLERLGGEIEKFKKFGLTTACVEFFYSEEV